MGVDSVYYQSIPIPVTKQVRYLEVILNGGLNYHAQLTAIVGMAKRALSIIYPYIANISPLFETKNYSTCFVFTEKTSLLL